MSSTLTKISSLASRRYAEFVDLAEKTYKEALHKADAAKLNNCDPLRLGIELNRSVFLYEIKQDTKQAVSIAQSAYHSIEEQLQHMQNGGDEYNDAATIMQLLYENLNMWTNELQEEHQGSRNEKNEY